jgi:hypothetical protein
MIPPPAREHHYVPQFLLRPWAVEGTMSGYWWNFRRGELSCRRKGPRAFCKELDLLTLRAHPLGRDAMETKFFGEIDTKGAMVRDILIEHGPGRLTGNQRCDFARLLLSLDARRPANVAKLRGEVAAGLVSGLDGDPEILAAVAAESETEPPSAIYERDSGVFIEDKALTIIQDLVDNPTVGGKLINGRWHVVRLGALDGSLVLADRPLIRLWGYDQPGATWVLPLTPKATFVAVNDKANLERIERTSPARFAKLTNISSANQAERYVFCVDSSHERWLGKYLSGARKAGG